MQRLSSPRVAMAGGGGQGARGARVRGAVSRAGGDGQDRPSIARAEQPWLVASERWAADELEARRDKNQKLVISLQAEAEASHQRAERVAATKRRESLLGAVWQQAEETSTVAVSLAASSSPAASPGFPPSGAAELLKACQILANYKTGLERRLSHERCVELCAVRWREVPAMHALQRNHPSSPRTCTDHTE